MDVYLEIGQKRVFAGAVKWLGWCRSGRDEPAALKALAAYGQRYGRVAATFEAPPGTAELNVVERLEGDATTDFGAPGAIPSADFAPVEEVELKRLLDLLADCWTAFDSAVDHARGRQLATGPRGGGRSVDGIVEHVHGAHASYARKVGGQADFEQALLARWRGEVADTGPARRLALAAALRHPPGGVAHPRPCVGDRRPYRIDRSLTRLLRRGGQVAGCAG